MSNDYSLEQITAAQNIDSVSTILTQNMASKSIQQLIKGDNLAEIVDKVLTLSDKEVTPTSIVKAKAAASLVRLAAVSKSNSR